MLIMIQKIKELTKQQTTEIVKINAVKETK